MKLQEIFNFLIGLVCGVLLFQMLNIKPSDLKFLKNVDLFSKRNLYEHALADRLFYEVKILCWVFTHHVNHYTKVTAVRDTWGRKCNKLIFMSTEENEDFPDIVALPVEDGRMHLWNKTKLAMKYVYDNYLNEYDWFMRADDDNFVLMENLRYFLYQYNSKISLYLGCRFAVIYPGVEEGFHAGGGHLFSRKGLQKFIEISLKDQHHCDEPDGEFDDVFVGKCLKSQAIFIDDLDELGQKRFFPLSLEMHLLPTVEKNVWYWDYLWRNVTQGSLECCSDTFVNMHYIEPHIMRELEFLIYNLHPFGLEKNLTETLPKKLPLNEIIKSSDKISFARNFRKHEIIHHIDDDERY